MRLPKFLKKRVIGFSYVIKCPVCGKPNAVSGRAVILEDYKTATETFKNLECLSCGAKDIASFVLWDATE